MMTENNEETFVPRSDAELARLLEEQLAALRGATGPAPTLQPTAAEDVATEPITFVPAETVAVEAAPVVSAPITSDLSDIFSALLEDQNAEAVVVETITVEDVIVNDEVVAKLIVDEIVVEEFTVEEVAVAAPGEYSGAVATTISETATSTPVPSMFGEAEYIAAVLDEPVTYVAPVVTEAFVPVVDAVELEVVEAQEPSAVPAFEAVAEPELVQPALHNTSPIASFAPRPSFDELVFGVGSDK